MICKTITYSFIFLLNDEIVFHEITKNMPRFAMMKCYNDKMLK